MFQSLPTFALAFCLVRACFRCDCCWSCCVNCGLQILGDYTPGKETVLLDSVKLTAGGSDSIPAACYVQMAPFAYR